MTNRPPRRHRGRSDRHLFRQAEEYVPTEMALDWSEGAEVITAPGGKLLVVPTAAARKIRAQFDADDVDDALAAFGAVIALSGAVPPTPGEA